MRSRLATGIFNVIPRSSKRPCRFSIERNWRGGGVWNSSEEKTTGLNSDVEAVQSRGGEGRVECRRGVTNVNTVSRCLPGSLKGSALDGKENIERASMLRHEWIDEQYAVLTVDPGKSNITPPPQPRFAVCETFASFFGEYARIWLCTLWQIPYGRSNPFLLRWYWNISTLIILIVLKRRAALLDDQPGQYWIYANTDNELATHKSGLWMVGRKGQDLIVGHLSSFPFHLTMINIYKGMLWRHSIAKTF